MLKEGRLWGATLICIANSSCMLLDRVSEISIRNCVVSPKITSYSILGRGIYYRLMAYQKRRGMRGEGDFSLRSGNNGSSRSQRKAEDEVYVDRMFAMR